MNCLEFEKKLMDLVGNAGRSTVTETQRAALAHAAQCERCQLRMAQEKSLTTALRTVAQADENLGLPLAAEMKLLAAFRAQHAPETSAPIVTSPRKNRFGWWQWATAAAALLLLFVFGIARFWQPVTSVKKEETVATQNSPTPTPSAEPLPPAPVPVPRDAEAPQAVPVKNRPSVATASPKFIRKNFVPAPPRERDRVTVEMGQFEVAEPEEISAQDFMVFDYARTMPPPERSQLMRVRFPREKLAPLGIPLPPQMRNRDYINTDLLMGSDGVPRAIRLAKQIY